MTLKAAIAEFLLHCRFEKNLSPKTLKAYETDLCQLAVHLKEVELIVNILKSDIRGFLASISLLKSKSIKRKVASIKALFNYLEFEDKIIVNPLRKMRIKIKEPHVLPPVMDMHEVVKIFKAGYRCKKEVKNENSYSYLESIRNIVVLELLFSTGARVSEVANLKTGDVNLNSGSIIIRGKGNRERIIQVCNKESLSILKLYYSLFESKIKLANDFLLINRFSQKLSDQSIRSIVKKIVGDAGILKRITPHTFRHSVATLLLENEVDIKYIQSLLGHSSITTTQIYTHVNRKRQRQLLKAKHPRRGFSMDTF